MALSSLGKFRNSLKFDARDQAYPLVAGPVYTNYDLTQGSLFWIGITRQAKTIKSTDGITWTQYNNNIPYTSGTNFYGDLRWINEQFVLTVPTDGNTPVKFYTSTDGTTWTSKTSDLTVVPSDITYSNGVYQVSTGTTGVAKIFTSTNLTTWTERFIIGNQSPYAGAGAWGIKSSGSLSLAVGQVHYIVDGYQQTPSLFSYHRYFPYVAYSTNGTTWANLWEPLNQFPSLADGDYTLKDIATDGAGNWIAVGGLTDSTGTSKGVILRLVFDGSNNLTSTTLNTTTTTNHLASVAFVANKWIILGQDTGQGIPNCYITSTNGTSWTIQTAPVDNLDASIQSLATSKLNGTSTQAILGDRLFNGTTLTQINYTIPNQQGYLDYSINNTWQNWKTLEFWIYVESTSSQFTISGIASQYNKSETESWTVLLEHQANSNPYLVVSSTGSGQTYVKQTATFSIAAWHHIRIVSDANVGAVFIDGVRDTNSSATFTTPTTWPHSSALNVGRWGAGNEGLFARTVPFWIDEFLMDSTALTSPAATTFSVPTRAYWATETQLLLLHFDTDFLDDSRLPITADSPLAAIATVSAQSVKTARITRALTAAVTLSAQVTRARFATAAFTSTTTANADVVKTARISLAITASTTLSATIQKIPGTGIQMSTTATLSAEIKKTTDYRATLTANAQVSAQATRIQQGQAALAVTGIELTAAIKVSRGLVIINADTNMTTQGNKRNGFVVAMTVTATQQALADKLRANGAELESTVTVTCTALKTKQITADMTASTTASTQAIKTAQAQSAFTTTATQTAVVTAQQQLRAQLQAQATLATQASKRVGVTSNQQAQATLVSSTQVTRRTQIAMQAFVTQLTAALKISYDPYYRIVIKPETRLLDIHKETRILTVISESRVNIIKGTIKND